MIPELPFDLKATPLRVHVIWAHIDDDKLLPHPVHLRKLYESSHLSVRYVLWGGNSCKSVHRLRGEKKRDVWSPAALRFHIRSPELPFFGERASYACPRAPMIYFSICSIDGRTPYRFFLNGTQYGQDSLPSQYQASFDALRRAENGISPSMPVDLFTAAETGSQPESPNAF